MHREVPQGKVPVSHWVHWRPVQHRLLPKYDNLSSYLATVCNVFLVPEPQPECRVDADCPSRLACLSEVCRDPCQVLSPCGQNADCTVQNTLPQRTMVCMCRPGYVGDADVACNLRKIRTIIMFLGRLTSSESLLYYIQGQSYCLLSNHIKHINELAYQEFLSVFVVVLITNIQPVTSSASALRLQL